MSLGKHTSSGRREPGKARRRAQERRQTVIVLTVFVLALIASVGSWVVFFAAWTPATVGQALPFTLPSHDPGKEVVDAPDMTDRAA